MKFVVTETTSFAVEAESVDEAIQIVYGETEQPFLSQVSYTIDGRPMSVMDEQRLLQQGLIKQ